MMTIKGTKTEIEMLLRKLCGLDLMPEHYEVISEEEGIKSKYVGIPINIEITEKEDE